MESNMIFWNRNVYVATSLITATQGFSNNAVYYVSILQKKIYIYIYNLLLSCYKINRLSNCLSIMC